MKTKLCIVFLSVVLAGLPAHALPDPVFESAAVSDSTAGSFANPAVLSFGDASGIGYLQYFGDQGFTGDFRAFFHTRVLGYGLSRESETLRHRFIFSLPVVRNLYLGSALDTASFTAGDTVWDFGLLYRPTDFLSFGVKAAFPPAGEEPRYITAAALRPLGLYGGDAHRIELFMDLPWTSAGMEAPKIGFSLEPLDGIKAGFGYDIEHSSVGFSLSLAFGPVRGGSFLDADSSGGLESGAVFAQASPHLFNYPDAATSDIFYDYSLGPELLESGRALKTGPFYFLMDQNSLLGSLEELERIEKTPYIDGLIFINSHTSMSLSSLIEVRDALKDLKASGKKIAFYSDYMSTMDYLLAASVGDEIYLHPQGSIDLRGLSVSSPYFKDFFEKIGIEVVNLNTGKYKSAYNFLSEKSMPAAEREALEYLLEGLYAEFSQLIESGRGEKLKKSAPELISDGPYLIADHALAAGLVDGLIQRDELREKVSFLSEKSVLMDKLITRTVRRDWSEPPAARVALIHADGPIHNGEGVPGNSIGADTLSRSIKIAREDDSVKAILLRVNSGGGSALASDMISREVELCRSGENAKPLIVSMAGTAASGGYYISAYADSIVASPAAITGSIGVIAALPNFAGLLEKQLIGWDVVRKGPRADFAAMYRRPSEDEKIRLRALLDHSYERFLQVVSEGRGLPVEEVKKIAGGRVWTGPQAMERGLIDEIGGYEKAFEVIRESAEISGEIELVDYSFAGTLGTISLGRLPRMAFRGLSSSDIGNPAVDTELSRLLPSELEYLYTYYRAVGDPTRSVMLVMPYYVEGISGQP